MADELTDFVDKEDQAVSGTLGVEVLLHPLAEVLDGERKGVLHVVEPLGAGLLALSQGVGDRLDEGVPVELVGVALVEPLVSGGQSIGIVEAGQLSLGCQIALHVGDPRMITTEALELVEDPQEDRKDGIAGRPVVGLAVDVKEDDIGIVRDGASNVAIEHGIRDLALEELDGPAGLAVGV